MRGYLAGSAWADYRRTGSVCGIELPPAPALPPEVVQKTYEKYKEAYERLTGMMFPYAA